MELVSTHPLKIQERAWQERVHTNALAVVNGEENPKFGLNAEYMMAKYRVAEAEGRPADAVRLLDYVKQTLQDNPLEVRRVVSRQSLLGDLKSLLSRPRREAVTHTSVGESLDVEVGEVDQESNTGFSSGGAIEVVRQLSEKRRYADPFNDRNLDHMQGM